MEGKAPRRAVSTCQALRGGSIRGPAPGQAVERGSFPGALPFRPGERFSRAGPARSRPRSSRIRNGRCRTPRSVAPGKAAEPKGGGIAPRPPPPLHRRGPCRSGRLHRGDGRRHAVKRGLRTGQGAGRRSRQALPAATSGPTGAQRSAPASRSSGWGGGPPGELPGRDERGVRDRGSFGEHGEGAGKLRMACSRRAAGSPSGVRPPPPREARRPARVSRLTHKCPVRAKRKILTAPRVALADCALPPLRGGG
jgi:hypothetical protein